MPARKAGATNQPRKGTASSDPVASRPRLPPEYGGSQSAKGMLPWSHVNERMRDAQHYWICTVTPDGRPHTTPIDGLWLDRRLYFGGSPESRWRRNLSANGAACIHLESATEVVSLHGTASTVFADSALAQRLADESKKKYGYAPKPEDYQRTPVLVFDPRVAFAWTNLPKDATRWHFGDAQPGQSSPSKPPDA